MEGTGKSTWIERNEQVGLIVCLFVVCRENDFVMRFVLRLTEEDGREEGLLSDDDRAFEQIQHDFRDALVHVVLLVDRDDGSDLQDTCQVAMWLRVPGGKRVGLNVD